MELHEFEQLINHTNTPEGLDPLLTALLFDADGNWEAAHNIAQMCEGDYDYDRLHAYLHRKEGDSWNANYWYRHAKEVPFKGTLAEEWCMLAVYYLERRS